MNRVMIRIVLVVTVFIFTLQAVQPEKPEFIGDTPAADTALDVETVRLKRTKSEVFVVQELINQFKQMKKEQEVLLIQSKEEEPTIGSGNAITNSLTSSTQSDNGTTNEMRINSLDIAAKLIRIREEQKKQQEINKKMHDTVIDIRTELKTIKNGFNSTRLVCGVSSGVVTTCQCLLLLFITAGLASLLAASY